MAPVVRQRLERKGLIERQVDPVDTRARSLRVTSRLAPRAIAAVERVDAEFFRGIDQNHAITLLRRLAARP